VETNTTGVVGVELAALTPTAYATDVSTRAAAITHTMILVGSGNRKRHPALLGMRAILGSPAMDVGRVVAVSVAV
jgi:hypothetical protein